MSSASPLPKLPSLTYRPDLEILIGRWGYPADEAELPAEYARPEAAALAHGARR